MEEKETEKLYPGKEKGEREIGRGLRDTERPIFRKRKRQGDHIHVKRRR